MRVMQMCGIVFVMLMILTGSGARADNALAVTTNNPHLGASSLEVTYDGTDTQAYLIDESPFAQNRYVVSFFLFLDEAGGFVMDNLDRHRILRANVEGGNSVITCELRRTAAGKYRVRMVVRDDAGLSHLVGNKAVLPDRWQKYTVDWKASSGAGANDGFASLQRNQGTPTTLANLDNDTHVIDQVQLGIISGVDSGTNGTLFYDDFESRISP